jgi:hypothetical protein
LSTLEGLEVFALGEGHRGVSSVGVLEYASGLRLVVCIFDSDRRLHLIAPGVRLVAAVAWGPAVACSRLTVFAFAAKALAVFLGYPLGKDLSASPAALFGLECSPVDFVLHFIVSG